MSDTSLNRFNNPEFDQAIIELKEGIKETCWIWFVFPQLDGLGYTDKTLMYELKGIEEAEAFLKNKDCKERLTMAFKILLSHQGKLKLCEIFTTNSIDLVKLISCCTLFSIVSKHIDDPEVSNLSDKILKWAFQEEMFECDYTTERCEEYYSD